MTPALTALEERARPGLHHLWVLLRPEFLYFSWAMMETALLAPLALSLMPWARYWTPAAFALWIFLLMLIPFQLSRLMSLFRWPVLRQQNTILLTFLLTFVLLLKVLLYQEYGLLDLGWLRELGRHFAERGNPFLSRDLLLFFLLSVLWWRGISLAGRRVDINDLGLRVRVGALIIAPLLVALAGLRLDWSIVSFLLLFMLSSLMAIALTRAEALERARTGRNYPMRPRWLLMVFGVSLLVVCVAWVIAAVASGQSLPVFLRWLNPLWTAALFAGTAIFTTAVYASLPLLAFLERIALAINSLLGRTPADAQELPEDNAGAVDQQFDELIRWLTDPQNTLSYVISRVLIFVVLVVVLLLILILLERYFAKRRLADAAGDQLSAGRREETDLARQGLGQRLLRRLGLLQQFRAASVRRLYRQMCQAATTHGYPRGEAETPFEYLATLGRAWPEGTAEAQLLTAAYVRVRYGEVPETHEELAALKDAWRRLERQKPVEMTLLEKKGKRA